MKSNWCAACVLRAIWRLAVACGVVGGPTPIRSILDDPRRYDGTIVTVAGEVRDPRTWSC